MDIYPISATPKAGLCDDLSALIETVATPRFSGEFLRAAQNLVGSGHVAAFSVENRVPQIVLAADRAVASLAYSATNTYVSRFWEQDPLNRQRFSTADLAGGVVVRIPANEFQRIPYRRDCYSVSGWSSSGIHLIERLSLIRRRGETTIRLDFYRPREAGAYCDADVERIAGSADVLFALIARHTQGRLSLQTINSRASLEKLIRSIAPNLPQREVQVCAGIALGLSSEAISNTLGIGLNTVRTYRKRAYARLQISSHNELLRAVFTALPAVGLDDASQQHRDRSNRTPRN